MTTWTVSKWDGFGTVTSQITGTYEQVRNTCSKYPSSLLWWIEITEEYNKRISTTKPATPLQKKFLDGTPVTPEYEAALGQLISGALEAEEHFSLDELEEFAEKEKVTAPCIFCSSTQPSITEGGSWPFCPDCKGT